MDDVQDRLNTVEIARVTLDDQKVAILARLNEFNGVMDASFSGTPIGKARPLAPSITESEEKFTQPLRDMKSLWVKVNAAAAPPGLALPLLLDGGMTQAQFVTALNNLKTAYADVAEAEQNFLIPSKEQALIWGDLVPQIVQSSKIQRFWNVTPTQMQWVALHLRLSELLLAESVMDEALRAKMVRALGMYAAPARARQVGEWLAEGRVKKALDNVTPSELFLVAKDLHGAQADAGAPSVVAEPDGEVAALYKALARKVAVKIAAQGKDYSSKFPTIAISKNT